MCILTDSKSCIRKDVSVRVRLGAPIKKAAFCGCFIDIADLDENRRFELFSGEKIETERSEGPEGREASRRSVSPTRGTISDFVF